VFSTLGNFLQVGKWRILRSNAFASNSVSNREKLLRRLFRCCNRLQQAYGEDCLRRMQCHVWYQRFKSGRKSIEDDPKSGRPSTSMDDDHVDKVLAVIRQNRRLTVREVAEEVGVCKSSCHLILTENGRCVVLPQNLCRVCWRVTPYPWIFDEAWDDCWLPASLLSRFGPCGLFLLPKRKSSLKGRRFQTVEEIGENSILDLRAVPQNTFQDAFQKWKKKKVGSGVSRVEGSTLKVTSMIKL